MKTTFLVVSLFLSAYSAHAAGSSIDGSVLDETRVVISDLGLSFLPIAKWNLVGEQALVRNLNRYDFRPTELRRILSTHAGSRTLASFMRDNPKTTAGIIPTVNVIAIPAKDTSAEAVLAAANVTLAMLRQAVKNLNVTQPLEAVTLSGHRAYRFKVEYELATAVGVTYRIQCETYVVPRNGALVQISMSDEIPAEEEETFSAFILGVKIESQP